MSTGIVCEFNPFHNGHKYLIDKAKEMSADNVICAMSGNFVQRGEYAIADKLVRAKWATDCGADLVLENPFPFSCSTAEIFAESGVSILKKSGCDSICFGVETDELSETDFFETAKILLDEKTAKGIAKILKQNKNIGFAVARSLYFSENHPRLSPLLDTPNNLLGVEYAKSILKNSYGMKIFTVRRKGVAHDGGAQGEFASGSYLRDNFDAEKLAFFCPKVVQNLSKYIRFCTLDKLYCTISGIVLTQNEQFLSKIAEIPQEYVLKIKREIRTKNNYFDFFEALRAKHITDAKLRRMLLYIIAGIEKDDLLSPPDAAFLLSFGENGAKILRKIKKENSDFTVLSKLSDTKKLSFKDFSIFEKQLCAEKLFERMI